MSVYARVTRVDIPRVSHTPNQRLVTVIYSRGKQVRTRRVFTDFVPTVGEVIEVTLL